jgi:FKBP-type peptidyl-prolyl cis-trans isomerase FklB
MSVADKLKQMKEEKAAANLQAGAEFLAANGVKPGVTTLPSGLQYEIMTAAEGRQPLVTEQVTCHYHGTLINGTIFDSSVQRGQPARFPLNKVIQGWQEALPLMAVGAKWRLFIPPQLGYGNQQVGSFIGPNSTLIFEVELLGVG